MRGDIYRLKSLRNAVGHEQRGPRYAVVLQSDRLHSSTLLVAPTSTSVRPASWRPEIDMDGTTTRVVVDQMTCVDAGRLGDFAGRLSPQEMAEVSSALRWVLELL
ncbi:MAG: type II toxin-antitoxin system PemK/MazF family toxin [Micromonosporaceae bacterium]|nr:type II toxin-antitoxin system PemK/MazF family toxin [Micromonosporaceae bacterium]